MALPEPVQFQIRPAIKGLHTQTVPQSIDIAESPALLNVRFFRGQITTRSGYQSKYFGGREPIQLLDFLWTATGGSTLFGLSRKLAYYESSGLLKRLPIYKGDSATRTMIRGGYADYFVLLAAQWWSYDIGKTIFYPQYMAINGGGSWPGSGDYADTTVVCNESDGIFVLINGSQGCEGQVLRAVSGDTACPVNARAIGFFDGRLIFGGVKGVNIQLYSYLQWSAKGDISKWSVANGGGGMMIGDDAEYIQGIYKLGEYLMVYKEGSVFIGRKTGMTDPPFSFTQFHSVGLAAPRSLGDLGTDHIFLGWDNVYVLNLEGIKSIADRVKQELLYGADGIVPKYYNQCIGTTTAEFDEYWLFVPTGKMPEYANGDEIPNLMPNPDFQHREIEGDQTVGGSTLTNVPAADYAAASAGDGLVGVGINTTIASKAGGTTFNLNTPYPTVAIVDNKIILVPQSSILNYEWDTGDDGGTSDLTAVSGGNFGGQYGRFSWTGAYGHYLNPMAAHLDLLTADVHEVSCVWWLKGNGTVTLAIEEQSAGVTRGTTTRVVTLTSSWAPYIVSRKFTNPNSDSRYAYCYVAVGDTFGTSNPFDVDAVTVVDLYSSSSKYVDDRFIYYDAGYKALGYIGPSGKAELLPFVRSVVGGYIHDTAWVYNYMDNSWTKWRLPVSGFGFDVTKGFVMIADLIGTVEEQTWQFGEKLVVAAAPSNLIAQPDGQVYEISKKYIYDWQGLLDQPLLSYWQSKDFDLGQPYQDKTLSRVVIYHETTHSAVDVEISASTDEGINWTTQTVTIRQGWNQTFADFFVTGTTIRFMIRASSPIAVLGWSVKIAARGEANAY